jgi:hypothetical protein
LNQSGRQRQEIPVSGSVQNADSSASPLREQAGRPLVRVNGGAQSGQIRQVVGSDQGFALILLFEAGGGFLAFLGAAIKLLDHRELFGKNDPVRGRGCEPRYPNAIAGVGGDG